MKVGDLVAILEKMDQSAEVFVEAGGNGAIHYGVLSSISEANPGSVFLSTEARQMLVDSLRMRRRAVHGWAFRDLPTETADQVKAYLETGDPTHLDGTAYRAIRDGMYKRGER